MVDAGTVGLGFALAIGLASIHLVAEKVPFTSPLTRERWLSAGAGVSIAYVFVYLLPKLESAGLHEAADVTLIYILVFSGLAGFFGLERIARETERHRSDGCLPWISEQSVFWIHSGVFVAYNVVIGYVLMSGTLIEHQIPFAVAMGLHLFGIDEGLRSHHAEAYHGIGRWVLAGSILAGSVAVFAVPLGVSHQIWLLSLLGGGIIFNAIKEELSEDRKSSFWAFILGAGTFVAIVTLFS